METQFKNFYRPGALWLTCADGDRTSERGLRLRSRHMHSTSSHSDSRQGITNAICCQYRMYGKCRHISVTFSLSNQTNKGQKCPHESVVKQIGKHGTSCARGTSEGSSRMTRRCIKCASISGPRLVQSTCTIINNPLFL